jgi:hypothetical protein
MKKIYQLLVVVGIACIVFGFTTKTNPNNSMAAGKAYFFGVIYDSGDVVHYTNVFYAPDYDEAIMNGTIEGDFSENFYSKYPDEGIEDNTVHGPYSSRQLAEKKLGIKKNEIKNDGRYTLKYFSYKYVEE